MCLHEIDEAKYDMAERKSRESHNYTSKLLQSSLGAWQNKQTGYQQEQRSKQYHQPDRHKKYGEMIWSKDTKAVQQRKDCLFSKWCWKNRISYAETNKTNKQKTPLPKQKGTQDGSQV